MHSDVDLLFRFDGLTLFFELFVSFAVSILVDTFELEEVFILESADKDDCSW